MIWDLLSSTPFSILLYNEQTSHSDPVSVVKGTHADEMPDKPSGGLRMEHDLGMD